MTLLIGESPYYWGVCTRLLVTLDHLQDHTGAAHRAAPMALDIVESPLNVNGKKFWTAISGQPSALSENFRFRADS
jgi:hypothetical protein